MKWDNNQVQFGDRGNGGVPYTSNSNIAIKITAYVMTSAENDVVCNIDLYPLAMLLPLCLYYSLCLYTPHDHRIVIAVTQYDQYYNGIDCSLAATRQNTN